MESLLVRIWVLILAIFIENFINKQNSVAKVINNTMKKVKREQDKHKSRLKVDQVK